MDKKEEKIFSRNRIHIPNVIFFKSGNNKNLSKILTIIAILSIAIIVLNTVIRAINPIIEEQCRTMAKSIATKISNDEATKVMANYDYEDFVKIEKDDEGNIKMISANMITINEVISDIPIRIQEDLEKDENNTFTLKLRKYIRKQNFFWNGARYKNKNDD